MALDSSIAATTAASFAHRVRCVRGLLVVVLVVGIGSAAPAGSARAGSKDTAATVTIRVLVAAADSRYLVDRAPKEYPNEGDVIREKATLRNAIAQFGRPKGALVGSDTWITTIVVPPFAKADVRATTTLPGGTIRSKGAISVTQTTATFRVLGGAGNYRGARGTIAMRNLNSSGSRGLAVYRLKIP